MIEKIKMERGFLWCILVFLSIDFSKMFADLLFCLFFFNNSNILLPAKIAASHRNTSLGNVHGKTEGNEGRELIGKLQISAS